MKLSCEKNTLYAAASICMHAVSSKSPAPILEGLLLRADEQLSLCGYNYKMSIKTTVEASVYVPGAMVIQARLFADILKRLEGDVVELSAESDSEVCIRCGASEFKLSCMQVSDYPEPPGIEKSTGFSLPGKTLKSMIEDTIFAVSDNQNKPVHTGSLFELENGVLTVVSVDGYRLAIRREAISPDPGPQRFIIPGDALREIMRILPDTDDAVTIYPEQRYAMLETGGVVITTRLLEGEFLNYKATIPADYPVRLQVRRQDVIDSVERVSILISERLKNPVRCVFEGTSLRVSCQTTIGSSYDECPIPHCAERIEIGFNNRYLLDALRAVHDEECIIELKSGLSPCIVLPKEGDAFLYLVLPVRLKAGE